MTGSELCTRRGVRAVSLYSILSLVVLLMCGVAEVSAADALVQALGARHESATTAQLEALAGGKDALVKRLLAIRTQERPMFVGVRAEKHLLQFADREDVQAALAQDVAAPNLTGLARVVMVHIDQVPTPEARKRLAEVGVARAKQDPEFVPFARVLVDSSDAEVSAMAKAAFQ